MPTGNPEGRRAGSRSSRSSTATPKWRRWTWPRERRVRSREPRARAPSSCRSRSPLTGRTAARTASSAPTRFATTWSRARNRSSAAGSSIRPSWTRWNAPTASHDHEALRSRAARRIARTPRRRMRREPVPGGPRLHGDERDGRLRAALRHTREFLEPADVQLDEYGEQGASPAGVERAERRGPGRDPRPERAGRPLEKSAGAGIVRVVRGEAGSVEDHGHPGQGGGLADLRGAEKPLEQRIDEGRDRGRAQHDQGAYQHQHDDQRQEPPLLVLAEKHPDLAREIPLLLRSAPLEVRAALPRPRPVFLAILWHGGHGSDQDWRKYRSMLRCGSCSTQ